MGTGIEEMALNKTTALLRLLVGVLLVLVPLAVAVPALADTLTPKAAMRAMTQAGYSGVGGVTHDLNFYYAAAVDAKRRRVRVTVDDQTGKIVAVVPLRGSGAALPAGTSLRPMAPLQKVEIKPVPRIVPLNRPPPALRTPGRYAYPLNSNGQLTPGWCRYRQIAPGC